MNQKKKYGKRMCNISSISNDVTLDEKNSNRIEKLENEKKRKS